MHVTTNLMLQRWVHVSGDRVTIQRCVPLGSMLYAHILSTAVAYFCVIADNDFLNDPHNLIYSWILLMLISLYVPVP